MVKGSLFIAQSEKLIWLQNKGSSEDQKVKFPEEKCGMCDVFGGDLVWDDSYPIYQSKDYIFLDE